MKTLYFNICIFMWVVQVMHTSMSYALQPPKSIWEKVTTANDAPVHNYGGHASCIIEDTLYIYGGIEENRSLAIDFGGNPITNYYGTMFSIDLQTNVWRVEFSCDAANTSCQPRPRGFLTLACSERLNKIWFFGGLVDIGFPGPSDDFWEYDVKTSTLSKIAKQAIWPAPRSASTLVYDKVKGKDLLILYGGANITFAQQSDTWIYDLESNSWSKIVIPPGGVRPRGNINAINTVYKHTLYVYSGEMEAFPGSGLQGLWRWVPQVYGFDIKHRVWFLAFDNSDEQSIINRAYSAYGRIGRYLFLFSGDYGVWRNGALIRNMTNCDVLDRGIDYLVPEMVAFDLETKTFIPSFLPESVTPVSPYKKSAIDALHIAPSDDRKTVAQPGYQVPPALKRSSMACDQRVCFITGGWGGLGTSGDHIDADQFYNNNVWKFDSESLGT